MNTIKQIITAIIAIIVLFTSRYIYQPIINKLPLTDEVAFDTAYILAAITTILVENYDVDKRDKASCESRCFFNYV